MKITKESIIGVGQDTSLVNIDWLRPNTPYTNDGIKKNIDSVEFEINVNGIEKLEQCIHYDTEYLMCFVHFDAGTENVEGVYLSVWDDEDDTDENIDAKILDEDERNVIVEYALEELKEYREE